MQAFDIVVVGAGIAGLMAAMHAARRGLKVAVVDRVGVGGQISTAERIENLPGLPQGVAGHELGPLLHEQAETAALAPRQVADWGATSPTVSAIQSRSMSSCGTGTFSSSRT